MLTVLWIIQIVSAVLLTILVLIHSPKGDGLGAIGGMANLFSSQKSAESGLNKLTANIGLIFVVTSFFTGFKINVTELSGLTLAVIIIVVIGLFYLINRNK